MTFSFYIAKRYLLSKKSHHAINIISGVSVCGVAIATAALVCILSVFNGFQDMVADLFTAFDPELKVVPAQGKFVPADADGLEKLKTCVDVDIYSETLEGNALLMAGNSQVMATIKGVEDNFEQLTDIDQLLLGDGVFDLGVDVLDYGIAGINLLKQLGLSIDYDQPLQVFAPRRGERLDLTDPSASLIQEELYLPRTAFRVKQNKYDSHYVITNIAFARRLFEKQGYVSSVELRLKPGTDMQAAKTRISQLIGSDYKVLDRYEQQADTFKIMQIEKLISYIFLTFILLIACFNIVGSLSMLIIDKRQDAITLRSLGADNKQISDIFMMEGRMICLAGAVIGIAIGLTLCLLQQQYGFIGLGSSSGSYIINAYPVSVHLLDLLIIFATVIAVGFISVWYPVRRLSKKYVTNS